MESIKLDLIPGKKMPSLHASQFDDGREHGIDLFENGVAYKLDGTEKLTINERKVDNNICSMDIENTFVGSSHIEFASFLQMCACAGSNFCELRISKGDVDLGTLNFILEVEPDPTADGIESESEIRNLKTQVEAITEEVIGDDYYTKTQTDEAIATAIEGKADTTYVNTELAKKADKTDTYTKMQVDNALNNKMNKANPSGTGSISVGSNMLNAGSNSQTFGKNTKAFNQNTFATGEGTTAGSNNQFVFGRYNQEDWRDQYVEIVGNGTNGHSSNARTLDWSGNETLAGDLTFNGNKSLTSEISRLDGKIDNLPAPMIFKGTLGVNGTIQSLPTASASNEGYTYKVITDGTYAGQTAKVGDVFTSNGSEWVYIPSGDEDNDTWRAIKVNGVEKLGNGISSGAVDFEDTANVKFEFDANGNKIKATLDGIYTADQVDTLLDDKADADNTYTKEQVDDIVYNILPDDTASGSVANFNTSLALPIKSLEVDVNAVQASGTPTPSSPKQIFGVNEIKAVRCGENLWNGEWEQGTFDQTTGEKTSSTSLKRNVTPIAVKPNTSYARVKTQEGLLLACRMFYYDKNMSLISTAVDTSNVLTITTPSDCVYINFAFQNNITALSINYPSTDTAIHAYNPLTEQITIALGGTYYGGHFTQDKDGHRQFVALCGYGDLAQDYSWQTHQNGFWYATKVAEMQRCDSTVVPNIKAERYTPKTAQYIYSHGSEYGLFGVNGGLLYITDSVSPSGKYVYDLVTPIIIDLPDGEPINTFAGVNNFFADTGDTEVVFKSSVNDYINAHQGGGSGAKSLGGVFLGGSNSGSEEEPTEEEPKEVTKTFGDEPISKK